MQMMEMEQETVYGTHEDSHVVMSEKVQSLAGSIYQEFEKMIGKYDEDVVKDLMPLVVNVLECLDLSYTENQEHEVELELLREDNEQLVTQYEREKQLRKTVEQKLLELEDAAEDERKDLIGKIESLESIVRMLELKGKNSCDHGNVLSYYLYSFHCVCDKQIPLRHVLVRAMQYNRDVFHSVYRLEEKEQDQKREYAKLHERYTELFKTHMDYMERTKILMGSAEHLEGASRRIPSMNIPQMSRSSGPVSFGFTSLEANMRSMTSAGDFAGPVSPPDSNHSNTSLRNELQSHIDVIAPYTKLPMDSLSAVEDYLDTSVLTLTGGAWVDSLSPSTKDSTPELEDVEDIPVTIVSPIGRTKTKKEQRSGNTLYQELSFQDAEALGEMDDGADITGQVYTSLLSCPTPWLGLSTELRVLCCNPGMVDGFVCMSRPADSDDESHPSKTMVHAGMGKEVENLILENNELLATKNALNIVKDDLIVKVDELTRNVLLCVGSDQEILREEIRSLQTMKTRLLEKIRDLEEEVKRVKEEAEKSSKATKSDDEEDVPMAQRKRFTRVEMARVLMERNQYKERFMELQEAVRWTEMIRASRNDSSIDQKNEKSIWKFNLFSSPVRPQHKHNPQLRLRYSAPTQQVSPALDTMKKRSLSDRKRGLDFLDTELSSEKTLQRRATERREQYRHVQAHVRKDDGRLQAYGWSLPAGKVAAPQSSSNAPARMSASTSSVPVPVPIYCRPLAEKERTTKMQLLEGEKICREGEELEQNLSSLVWICTSTHSSSKVSVIHANTPGDILDSFNVCTSHVLCIASVPVHPPSRLCLKELLATSTDQRCQTCHILCEIGAKEIDYLGLDEPNNKEATELEEQEHGSLKDAESEKDNEENREEGDGDVQPDIGKITFVSCVTGSEAPEPVGKGWCPTDDDRKVTFVSCVTGSEAPEPVGKGWCPVTIPMIVHHVPCVRLDCRRQQDSENESAEATPTLRLVKEVSGVVKDGLSQVPKENDVAYEEMEKMSSVLATMWLGSQSGKMYVHSAVSQWRRCLHSVKLNDSILNIVHIQGRVFTALANGTVAIFRRGADGQWDLGSYHLVDLGNPQHSIRCMVAVHSQVWCGYRNQIHKTFVAHPRKESQVRQMAWLGDGVWVSIRLDSTLRLYHAHTYQHLQDVDIEPYVSKMLGTGKLGFSFVRITALLISSSRLWIGTGNGVIISVPLSEKVKEGFGNQINVCRDQGLNPGPPAQKSDTLPLDHQVTNYVIIRVHKPPSAEESAGGRPGATSAHRVPGGVVRVYADNSAKITPGSFIPYCSMAQAQLSFHGHRDAVKFFVAVPGSQSLSAANPAPIIENLNEHTTEDDKPPAMLVMSGGEGYIDFRTGDGEEEGEGGTEQDDTASHESANPVVDPDQKFDLSHLIIWEMTMQG
uniref:JNK-interacting protein 3 n=1 Tax=Timema shepardi TaxID=629360 RepID=A0A7R9G020_TIMSH|nr:unnamed protein product [Timema shepardi]